MIRRAADLIGADSFFIVIATTQSGNRVDQAFWHDTASGLNPVDKSISCLKEGCGKGVLYPIQQILDILEFVLQNTHVTLGDSVHHQVNGIPQGGHASGHMANLTCHHYERKWVEKFPYHSLQYAISRFMDDFGAANAAYFQEMYTAIYPPETGIRLVPNLVNPKAGRVLECRLLDLLIYTEQDGKTHITLFDKRADFDYFVNRFPDIDSNVSRAQTISTFYGEIVRLFRINAHQEGFFQNVAEVASYLIVQKRYPQQELCRAFSRFLDTQKGNPRLLGMKADLETIFAFKLLEFIQVRTVT